MFFNSIHYLLFAPLVILGFYLFRGRVQKIWLLLASLYFYAVFEPPFVLLLLFSIVATHFSALALFKARSDFGRRLFLWIGVLSNLTILYLFKFVDFSFEIYNLALSLSPCDSAYASPVGVVLPVGISFFSLQAIAYVVDVYRKSIGADRSLFHFALFLSFFPQLVAGPIMRASDLLHQFAEEHKFTIENFRAGIGIVALGFFKKTFLADPASISVNEVFANPEKYSWAGIWLGGIFFIFQIYGDFSGYSDIAIGTGRIMGFRIPRNFLRPFLADRLSDLWNRWHISLSSWLRDYVYIPLGGSRVALPRYYVNIFVTMALSGVWHGSGLNFVFWGVYHAALVVIERMLLSIRPFADFWNRLPRMAKVWYPFLLFAFSGLQFRAQALPEKGLSAMGSAWLLMERALSFVPGALPEISTAVYLAVFVLLFIEIAVEHKNNFFDFILKNNFIYYCLVFAVIGYSALVYAMSKSSPFVYFQF